MIRSLTGWWGVVLDAPNAAELAGFYSRLLGWRIGRSDDTWATIEPPSGRAYIAFQTSEGYEPPVWPPEDDEQQMMMHLDVGVEEVEGAVRDAVELGARVAEYQPQDDVTVMLDPAGHPFCLYADEPD